MQSHRRSFLKQVGLGAAGLSFSIPWFESKASAGTLAGKQLPRTTPEAQGVSSQAILDYLEAIRGSKHEFHSLMILRHGHVIAEGWWRPYRPDAPQMLYSLSKSFTSTGVGLAAAEGRLKVTDKVTRFFPDDLPQEVSPNLAALTVKDLLTMSVGHGEDSTGTLWGKDNWVKQFLSLPIPNPPGTKFLYNSGATYMLSAIVQKLTGEKLVDYLRPRLFDPLGIEDATWEVCPRGINTGGWGLKLCTEALARFGQLYLQKGLWNGKQVIPAAWVEEATSFKIQQPAPDLERAKQTSDWHQGYCYQFWRCRNNAFRGDGAFGQYTIVMPDQDAVIAITSESSNMQGQMNLVWDHLFPAMKTGALPAARPLQRKLKEELANLQLPPPKSQPGSRQAEVISGKEFKLDANPLAQSASFRFGKGVCVFSLKDRAGEHPITCGIERWVAGETSMPGTPPKLTQGPLSLVSRVAASATWKDENTLEMMWRFYESPHHDRVTCRFDGAKVQIEFLNSLAAMGNRKDNRPVLVGQTAPA